MDKSLFFSSLGGYLKTNKAFFISVLIIILGVGGYFWWQAGFSLEIGRFFASEPGGGDCADQGNTFCSGNKVMMWETDVDGGCVSGVVETCNAPATCVEESGTSASCVAPPPVEPPPAEPPPAEPPPAGDACSGFPLIDEKNNTKSCLISSSWGSNLCKVGGKGMTVTYKARIINNQPAGSHDLYSRVALFYSSTQTCSAHASNPGNASGLVSPSVVKAGETKDITYTFTVPDDCGSWQLDDQWGPDGLDVIGKVINTGVNCSTPPPASPSTSPSTPPASPSSSPSTPPASPSTSPTPGELVCAPTNQTVRVGQAAILTASGGVPPYSWYAPNGTPSSGTAQGIAVTYAAAGNYSIALNDSGGAKESICYVTVEAEPQDVLTCTASVSRAQIGQTVDFSATGGNGTSYAWYAPEATGVASWPFLGNPLRVSYGSAGFKTVMVVSGANQAACSVTIAEPIVSPSTSPSTEVSPSTSPSTSVSPSTSPSTEVSPSASPILSPSTSPGTSPSGSPEASPSSGGLVCSPASQDVRVGRSVSFSASGGTPSSYQWTAPSGDPSTASGSASFTTNYGRTGTYTVTVRSGARSASCSVRVTSNGDGTMTHLECVNNTCARVRGLGNNECSVVGVLCSGSGSPYVALDKMVRNVTQNSAEQNSVTAVPGNVVEFSLKVIAHGSGTLNSVTVRDALPAGLTYISGSTTIDGIAGSDGIVSTGLNLGNMPSGRTITVRFRATVSSASFFSAGTTVLTNTGHARAANDGEVSDVAFVSVVQMPANATLSLTKTGRNTTRGETAEASLVNAAPAQTIEFVLRVRNTSSKTLSGVMVRDVLPPAITLVPDSIRIGTASASNSLTAAGLGIGTLMPGQEVVVRFSGLVASSTQLPSGTTTVINTATVSATGEPTITAQLPVVITNGGVVIPPVKTGPGETTVLALIISAIITLLYVGYTSTDTYRRHEAGEIAREARGDESDFSR